MTSLDYAEALQAEAEASAPPPLLREAEFAQLEPEEPEPTGLWARIRSMFR